MILRAFVERYRGRPGWKTSGARATLLAAITFVGYFILSAGSVAVTARGPYAAIFWPASAFALSMLIRQSRTRQQDFAMLAVIFIAGLSADILFGLPLWRQLGYNIVGTAEVALALVATRRFPMRRMGDLGALARFGMAAVVVPCIVGAFGAAAVAALSGQAHGLVMGGRWFVSNFLGFTIVLPFGLALSWRQLAKLRLESRALEALLVGAMMVLISYYSLRMAPHPLLFLVLATAIVATARFRLLGAGAAMFIILGIILLTTPGAEVTADPMLRMNIGQLFLAVCSLITVRTALLLNQRDVQAVIIERQRRRALRASRFKTELLSHVSHEVRQPLSAIIGFSGLLESGELPPERAQEFAHVVAHNGDLLQRLHDDLRDLARAEAGALRFGAQRVNVGEMLKTCIGAIRLDAALAGKPVVIEAIADTLAVNADPKRLAQIVNNLIANAFKYGDNISPIRVRALRLADGFGRIEISNAGPGISLRERDALFRPLKAEGGGRQVSGAGLGLSIAKMLVERQGGRIDFESIPGRQTRFWIDLPLSPEAAGGGNDTSAA